MTKTNNIGAINALKGYRIQFLYSLFRILSHKEHEVKFCPEGEFEDLDIRDINNNLLEVIQVKNLTDKLTLSDIIDSNENSFLKRAINAHLKGNSPIIKLISTSDVNEDIKALKGNNYSQKIISKLKNYKFNDREIQILQTHFDYETISENTLKNKIIGNLETSNLFSDNNITLDILIYWIYYSAEFQVIIDTALLYDKFQRIGKFLSERTSFHKYFGVFINPIISDNDAEDIEILKSDFYKGVSAKYSHIVAGMDIYREERLCNIVNAYKKSNVVFIHGASGQGKSALAYRYLHDFCIDSTVYELRLPPDLSTMYDILNALEGITKGIGFPITLYIDVIPGNIEWIRIIEELSTKKNFKFLITIREEDWNTTSIGDKFQFSEVELFFDKTEAELIYNKLNEFIIDKRFVDFEEAWDFFGENGPLLEFTYLITQRESLFEKIKSQINRIFNNAFNDNKDKIKLSVLRYVSLADTFGARISTNKLAEYLQIEEITHIIELLKREYLLQTTEDDKYIVGLHPVRSSMIVKLLFDETKHKSEDYALNTIVLIRDNDILDFLRNSFKRTKLEVSQLLEKLKAFKLSSWCAYEQILKALQWKGIYDYINKNINHFNEIYNVYQSSWYVAVNFDFSGMMNGKNFIEYSDIFTNEQKLQVSKLNQNISSQSEVFEYCKYWLESINEINVLPIGEKEWLSFGNFLFWLVEFKVSHISLKIESYDLKSAFCEHSLETLSTLLYSLKKYNADTINEFEELFVERLRKQFNIVVFDNVKDKISCIFFTDLINEKIESESNDLIHAKSIQIIDIIRYAFPDKETYGTKGYGHEFKFIPDFNDSSYKEIPIKNLPLKQLVDINSTFINLFDFIKRPASWEQYVNAIIYQRRVFIEVLSGLRDAFIRFHKQENYQVLAIYLQKYLQEFEKKIKEACSPIMPCSIISEWGNLSEREDKNRINKKERVNSNLLSLRKYDKFLKYYKDYSNSIENYVRQSAEVILNEIKINLKEAVTKDSEISRISLVGNLYKAYEILSEFQLLFRKHFEKFIELNDLRQIEKKELELITFFCFVWRHFLYTKSYLKGNVNNYALQTIEETKLNFNKKIKSEIRKLSKEQNVLINVDFFENLKKCVIKVETYEPINAIKAVEFIYQTIFQIINKPDYTSIKRLIIDTYYSTFVIIPTNYGKTLNNKWYEFPSYKLAEKEFHELEQLYLIPKDIEPYFIEKYNLKAWNKYLDDIKQLEKMLEHISLVYQLAYHLIQLKAFNEFKDVDNLGEEILLEHLSRTGQIFQVNIQNGLDLYGQFATKINEEYFEIGDDKEKLEFYNLFIDTYKIFYPNDTLFEEKSFHVTLGTAEMEEWLPRLEILTNNISVIYFYLAGKAIKKQIICTDTLCKNDIFEFNK